MAPETSCWGWGGLLSLLKKREVHKETRFETSCLPGLWERKPASHLEQFTVLNLSHPSPSPEFGGLGLFHLFLFQPSSSLVSRV